MKKLIVDMSPILYANLISSVGEAKREGAKKNEDGIIEFNESVLIYKVITEIAMLKTQFKVDEVILAFDNSKGGYWRKNYYDRYKYGRKEGRDKSEIDWNAGFTSFNKINEQLIDNSSFRCVSVETTEADDIAFVLSKRFSEQGDHVILHTIDRDWEHALNYSNVEVFRTRKTQRKPGLWVQKTPEEREDKIAEHCIAGDPGDGFLHIKSWTKFSDDFLIDYPKFKGRELELYDKHHQIEAMFNLKYDWTKKAYKHPRFGYASFKKGKKTLEDILKEHPIHRMNYERNKKLCLPMFVPDDLSDKINIAYDVSSNKKNIPELQKFFTENQLFELNTQIPLL